MINYKKILIIRFSSIGDVILTSPVVRCLKNQTQAEIHFLTKENFSSLVRNNPHIDKVVAYHKGVLNILKAENYDLIVDLHNNLRSRRVRIALKAKVISFNKLNIQKWLKVNLKIDRLPDLHIVDRYFQALQKIGITDDGEGLEFFSDQESKDKTREMTAGLSTYCCLVLGANYHTKRIPLSKCKEIIENQSIPVILIGGDDTIDVGQSLNAFAPEKIIDFCGKLNIQESAEIIRSSQFVITGDTGMMHIAAAFKKRLFTLWGSTIPAFGMYPYYGKNNLDLNTTFQVENLSCRPCSKLGFNACPKGHFNCMNEIEVSGVKGG